jgi:hypothetical protein
MYTLRISPAIANEWNVRCIGDVIPALADRTFEPGKLQVSEPVLREILADCEFMADPRCVDASAAERSAYRGLRDQCKRALSIGPVEQQCC